MLPMLQNTLEDMLEQQAWHMMNDPAFYSGLERLTWEPSHERRSGFMFGFCVNFSVDRTTEEICGVEDASVFLRKPAAGANLNRFPRFARFGSDFKLRSDFPTVLTAESGRTPRPDSLMSPIVLTDEEEFKMIMWATEVAQQARDYRSALEKRAAELTWDDDLTDVARIKIMKRAIDKASRRASRA